jgi:hypothetical protein
VRCQPEGGIATIAGEHPDFTLTNETGVSVPARLEGNTIVILVDVGWPNGTLNQSCDVIEWNNGTLWVR